MPKQRLLPVIGFCMVLAATLTVRAEAESPHPNKPDMHHAHQQTMSMQDSRTLVHFPAMLRIHTLANMRNHLLSLGEIQAALANKEFSKASDIAEQRLGLSSLKLHGAHKVAKYMPREMRELGMAMHRSASHFALVASNSAVSGDVKPALNALSRVTQNCVACHSTFRLH